MDDLVTWLSAQLDEDTRVALDVAEKWRVWVEGRSYPGTGPLDVRTACDPDLVVAEPDAGDWHNERMAVHIAHWDPARVLAEVEAKRARLALLTELLEKDTGAESDWSWHDEMYGLIELEALPYRNRPGYRPEWAPDR